MKTFTWNEDKNSLTISTSNQKYKESYKKWLSDVSTSENISLTFNREHSRSFLDVYGPIMTVSVPG